MSATEELRRLLDERGVRHEKAEDDTTIYYDSDGNRYTYNVNPESGWAQLFGYNLTPEQAIAATLGEVRAGSSRFELTAEQVHEAIFNGSSYASFDGAKYYADGIGMQAIADELNAALGGSECEQVLADCDDGLMPPFTAHCSKCKTEWGFTPKFCPECGAKVTGVRDERKAVKA